MNKQDILKLQPCVLRVNIQCDCEGCHQKVKKTLQKIDGVHKVNVDVEQGKVTVLGNVDPETLIKKLEKAGKNAELWGGGQKGQIPNLSDQFKKMLMENAIGGKDGGNNKSQKGGKPQMLQGGFLAPQNNKGAKMEPKKFKPLLREDDEDDDDEFDDEDDYDDDEFDDESEDSFGNGHKPPPIKLPTVPRGGGGLGPQGNNVSLNALVKDNKGKKKGGGFDKFLKGMLGKAGGKKGNLGKGKGGNQEKGGGKKDGHDVAKGESKNGDKEGKGKGNAHKNNGGGKEKDNASWSKKGGKNSDGVPKLENIPIQGFNDAMNGNHKGNIGLASQKGNFGNFPMGQMGNFHAPPPMMNGGGHFQGFGQGYPQHEQQYNVPWMMNQQPGYGQNMYHPLMHMRPHPAASYGPPHPGNDRYTHMFDDENPNSCSIM